jgi:hypothetical protein
MNHPFPDDKNDQRHLFLATGNSLEQARGQAAHFINTTQLVIYQSITINDKKIRSGASKKFWTDIEEGIAANHLFCHSLMQELQDAGSLHKIADLLNIQQGYPSKLLHILTHMLDGFFGIDSNFYNLIEDSHWISDRLRTSIQQNPKGYWLVPVWHGKVTIALLHRNKKTEARGQNSV